MGEQRLPGQTGVGSVCEKYGTHKREYIGKMVDGLFVPNKKYQLQMQVDQIPAKKRGPVPVTQQPFILWRHVSV